MIRVAILGGVTLILFATVFFRLLYLQVLSGDQYVSQANDNRVREIRIPAPRGDIVDRSGRSVLVTSRQATVVQIDPSSINDDIKCNKSEIGLTTKQCFASLSIKINDGKLSS